MPKSNLSHTQRRAHWRRHVLAWSQSGLSRTDYSRREAISPRSLSYWIKQFRNLDTPKPSAHLFLKKAIDVTAKNAAQISALPSEAGGFCQLPLTVPLQQSIVESSEGANSGATLTCERWTLHLPGTITQENLTSLLQQIGGTAC